MENVLIEDKKISKEIELLKSESLNETEYLMALYYDLRMNGIISNSGLNKQARWAYAEAKHKLTAWPLYQRKAAALDSKIKDIQELEKLYPNQYEEKKPLLLKLIENRNETRALYMQIVMQFDELKKTCKVIESQKINLADLQLEPAEVLQMVEALDGEEKYSFWKAYFENKPKYIYGGAKLPTYVGGSMGE